MGAPDLTDNVWLYGSSFGQIQQTLRYGRNGRMPAQEEILGNDKVHLLAAYVYSLSQKSDRDFRGVPFEWPEKDPARIDRSGHSTSAVVRTR
jgi:hypothetical protein